MMILIDTITMMMRVAHRYEEASAWKDQRPDLEALKSAGPPPGVRAPELKGAAS